MSKKSIRFFDNREVRAVWNEEHISGSGILRSINDEDDYVKRLTGTVLLIHS